MRKLPLVLTSAAALVALTVPLASIAWGATTETCVTKQVVVTKTVKIPVKSTVHGKVVTKIKTEKVVVHVKKRVNVAYRVRVNGKLVTKHHFVVRSVIKTKTVKTCVPIVAVATVATTTVAPPVTTTAPTTTTTAPAPSISYTANVDPTFTQDEFNPLEVTYSYSASSTANPLPSGILNLLTPGGNQPFPCSINVGSFSSGGTCDVTYPATGTYQVTTQYIPNGVSAVTQTDSETINPFSTSISESKTSINAGSGQYDVDVDSTVTDQNGNFVSLNNTGDVKFKIIDQTTGTTVATLSAGDVGACDFTMGQSGSQMDFNLNSSGFVCGIGQFFAPLADSYAVEAFYGGVPGYSPSTSSIQALP